MFKPSATMLRRCRWESCRSRMSPRLRPVQRPRATATARNWPWRHRPTNAISSKASSRWESSDTTQLTTNATLLTVRFVLPPCRLSQFVSSSALQNTFSPIITHFIIFKLPLDSNDCVFSKTCPALSVMQYI